MRASVLMNSWDSFLVTLPSISSESYVICSWLILGTDVFRDWPFRGCSFCDFLATAANFRLFLNVAVAARLRRMRTNDPLKGHSRPIEQKLKLGRDQTYH